MKMVNGQLIFFEVYKWCIFSSYDGKSYNVEARGITKVDSSSMLPICLCTSNYL